MNESKMNVLKRKTTMIRLERHHNCRKKHLSVAVVIQFLNSYHKMLERAQSKQNLIAQWGPPVKVSRDLEQKDGTLFVKDMRRELGLLQRILSVNMGNVVKKSTEVGRADNNENTENEYKESCYQTRSSRNKDNKTYDGSLFDDSESGNDDDDDYQVKSKKKSLKGWLGRKFTHGKDEVLTKKANDDGLSKRKSRQFIKIEEDEEEVPNSLEVNTPEFGAIAEEPQDTTIEKENREKSAASKFTNYLKSFKIPMIKRKHKRDNESEATLAECPGKPEVANTENGEDEGLQAAPTRKRRKKEQRLVSCPMCDGMFVESEINDHAFTCNGEPPEAARSTVSRDPLLDQSLDYIPLQPEERPSPGNPRKPVENSDGFSEWKNACKRVVVSKNESGRHVESLEINHENLFESIAQESKQIEKDDIQAFETKKKPRRQMKRQKPASHNVVQNETRAGRMKQKNVDSNWMSDDSEDSGDKSELLNQYLGVKKTDKSRNGDRGARGAKRGRAKPRLDEEDSLDESENCEKCFLCSTIIVKAKYPSHVMKCIAAAERGENVARKTDVPSDNVTHHSQEPQNDEMNGGKNRLKQQLGNRTSWAQYDKVDRGDSNEQDFVDIEEDNEKHADEDESPIKSFKPVGETSLFNFDNQFKNNMPKRRVKLSRNVAFKNGNR